MKRRRLWAIWCVVMWVSSPAEVQAVSITVHTDRASWESAITGTILEESFSDDILNSDITVQSDMGYVNTSTGVWWDRMSSGNNWTTTFNFSSNMTAFGGEWDLAVPGGPGQGILVTLPYSTAPTVLSIDRQTEGIFWGFVSDTSFNTVTLEGWTQNGWAETFELDNLVYSGSSGLGGTGNGSGGAVPEPGTMVLFGTGLTGLLGWRVLKGRE